MTSMSHLPFPHNVAQRFLNRVVHDGQISGGDQSHEARHKFPAAFHPVVDAGISIFERLGPNMRDDVFGEAIEVGSKIVGHESPPHEAEEHKRMSDIGRKNFFAKLSPYKYRRSFLFQKMELFEPLQPTGAFSKSGTIGNLARVMRFDKHRNPT